MNIELKGIVYELAWAVRGGGVVRDLLPSWASLDLGPAGYYFRAKPTGDRALELALSRNSLQVIIGSVIRAGDSASGQHL
jgi:hypothetical protein